MRDRILLLTATVTPQKDVGNLRVRDPQGRRREYEDVFRKSLQLVPSAFDGVVLAENSGADLSAFRRMAGDRSAEVLSVPAWSGEGAPGRGFLETHLIQEAISRSRLVHELRPRVVWKVTGRYWVANLGKLVTRSEPGCDLYMNLRRFPERWADMWVYGVTTTGMDLLGEQLHRLWEGENGPSEREMFNIVTEIAENGGKVAPRFPVEPRIEGRRGTDAVSYGSVQQRTKWFMRSMTKRVAPRIWI